MESEWITADMVEATKFPELVRRYAVRGVPRTVINGRYFIKGAMPAAELAEQIFQAVNLQAGERESVSDFPLPT
jgi:predicted DsbA family dithiol-disulfide isomerase